MLWRLDSVLAAVAAAVPPQLRCFCSAARSRPSIFMNTPSWASAARRALRSAESQGKVSTWRTGRPAGSRSFTPGLSGLRGPSVPGSTLPRTMAPLRNARHRELRGASRDSELRWASRRLRRFLRSGRRRSCCRPRHACEGTRAAPRTRAITP